MRRRTVTLMQELPHFLRTCSVEELYHLVCAIRHDLVRRGIPAGLIADELSEVLLTDARAEHRAIFSADCGRIVPSTQHPAGAKWDAYAASLPPAEKS